MTDLAHSGPWLVIRIGPSGYSDISISLETEQFRASTGEGQTLVFSFEMADFSTHFGDAWEDGRAKSDLKAILEKLDYSALQSFT